MTKRGEYTVAEQSGPHGYYGKVEIEVDSGASSNDAKMDASARGRARAASPPRCLCSIRQPQRAWPSAPMASCSLPADATTRSASGMHRPAPRLGNRACIISRWMRLPSIPKAAGSLPAGARTGGRNADVGCRRVRTHDIHAVAFSPDATHVLVGGERVAWIWKITRSTAGEILTSLLRANSAPWTPPTG